MSQPNPKEDMFNVSRLEDHKNDRSDKQQTSNEKKSQELRKFTIIQTKKAS